MQKEELHTCEYEGCNLPINKPHDNKFCIFHAPKERKGITVEKFNEMIFQEKIEKNDFNFEGYVFPGKTIFPKVKDKELENVNFIKTQFSIHLELKILSGEVISTAENISNLRAKNDFL